jgi:hypothetical protein
MPLLAIAVPPNASVLVPVTRPLGHFGVGDDGGAPMAYPSRVVE